MPSSFTFLRNSQSNSSSSSSSENDSNSDQSDDDRIHNDNDMLERPSDHDDSDSQSEESEPDEKKNDLLPSPHYSHPFTLSRQLTLYDNDWPKKSSTNENQFQKSIHHDQSSFLQQFESNDTLSSSYRLSSPERTKSVGLVHHTYLTRNIPTTLPSDFTASVQDLRASFPALELMQSIVSPSPRRMEIHPSPRETSIRSDDSRRPISKIPIRTNSSSQSRSRSPVGKSSNRRIPSPTISSKIPVPVSAASKGAFRFFTADDRPVAAAQPPPPPVVESIQATNLSTKQISPFTPITHSKPSSSTKKTSSSAGNTPSAKGRRAEMPSTDEESDHDNLKEEELKLKLKEQKRNGRKTGDLLNKLHENYEELLEKYAQAENTIDQLRFQPKLLGDNTPPSNASEGMIHFIQQPKMNMTTVRSNGIYHPSSTTPLSSIRQVPSTTTTTSALKSTSPTNSYAVESVFFDEVNPQKIIVQELTTPETLKLDLLIQTKTLSEKMKSFLTLMDANQLSLAEQQQVYESIKDDYEKLLKTLDRTKRGSDLSDVDLDGDLNQELETMKQLLKEIVKRITDNLLGKSMNSSETGRQSRLTQEESQSGQSSARSSLCNHADLMEQYQKLLNAVNNQTIERKPAIRSPHPGVERTISRQSSQSDISAQLPPTGKGHKPYVYVSENSDEEQQRSHSTAPVSTMKRMESASFGLDQLPVTAASKHQQQVNEEPRRSHETTKRDLTPSRRRTQDYDNLDNITKGKRKGKTQTKKHPTPYRAEKELSPSPVSIPTNVARFSSGSVRTRTSDYDSGIGTNNTTKISRDRLNTSNMDESHYQSLDEDKRRCSDEGQESMSTVSSRSSGSGAASPKNVHSKYTKRIGSSSSLKRYENARRKPSGHSDTYQSDVETHLTGSFDPLPQPSSSSYSKRSRRSHHSWQPQRSVSDCAHRTPHHRSYSIENLDPSSRPQTAPDISSRIAGYYPMGRKYQSGFVYRSTADHRDPMYKSSFYIDQAHTNRRMEEKIDLKPRAISKNLYLDPQTGVIYRYIPNTNQPPTVTCYQPTTQVQAPNDLYQCGECGSITNFHHRHHIERINKEYDDPGYESGNRKLPRHRRYVEPVLSSDSDLDETSNHLDMSLLNEAYERARKAQHRSQNLSKHISRQLRLVLGTM